MTNPASIRRRRPSVAPMRTILGVRVRFPLEHDKAIAARADASGRSFEAEMMRLARVEMRR